MTAPLAVTVSASAAPSRVEHARRKATAWSLPYFERPHRRGLAPFFDVVANTFLVYGADGWTLTDREGALRFSPGMAALRLGRIEAGHADDVLVRLAELRAGDTVVDATLGLGSDALVCARVCGPTGRIIGVERSMGLWALASEGLPGFAASEGWAPIEVRHGDARELLAQMPTSSADCVLLDPMFDRPQKSTPAFEVLRRHACHDELDAELLRAARRVARRWVVVKGGRGGSSFSALGLAAEQTSRVRSTIWARVGPGGLD